MDTPPPPTAKQLGISEGEHERIVRDLARRRGETVPTAPSRPRPTVAVLVVVGLVVGAVALLGLERLPTGSREPSFAFLEEVGDGRPVTYSSCAVIQVAVYPAGGPPDAFELVNRAAAQMRSATGLDIVVTGPFGGHAPNWNFEAARVLPGDPIVVSWQDGDAIAGLGSHAAAYGGSRTFDANGIPHFAAGTIALSRSYYSRLTAAGDDGEALAVLLHEFGHVFGLAHVESPDELMYDGNNGRTTLGRGDLEGLRILGQGPCV